MFDDAPKFMGWLRYRLGVLRAWFTRRRRKELVLIGWFVAYPHPGPIGVVVRP